MSLSIDQLRAFLLRRIGALLAVLLCVSASTLLSEWKVAAQSSSTETRDGCVPPPESKTVRAARPFLMAIEDVFPGNMVTGIIETGVVNVGDEVEIVGIKETVKATVTGIEIKRKPVRKGRTGDPVAVSLRVRGGDLAARHSSSDRGRVLAAPGAIRPHRKFDAEAYIATREEAGRNTAFPSGESLELFFRTVRITGVVRLPEGIEKATPGGCVAISVLLEEPIAMDTGSRFRLYDVTQYLGVGAITKIHE